MHKNLSIIQRLLHISLSVAVVWLMLAAVNVYIWLFFDLHGDGDELHGVLILRLVILRCVSHLQR